MVLQSLLVLLLLCAGLVSAQTTGATFGKVYALGGTPDDVVFDEGRGRIYLVNGPANRVDIFSIAEERIIRNILVGTFPSSAAMSMDGAYLHVSNATSASLSVIDLENDAVIQTVSLPARPEGVAVGMDGRVLITTQGAGTGNALNQLLVFDRNQSEGLQVSAVIFPPPITTPSPLPALFVGRPTTAFPGRMIVTPDGQFIIGMVAINQTANTAQTTLFVYEAASGVVLRNRTVTGQSTVLSISPDGSRFMAGSTLYDTATLNVIGQMNTANLPFLIQANANPNFNVQQNFGGSVFGPDGDTLYSAFNTSITNQRPVANVLYISNAHNLGVRLGIKLPESILRKMLISSDGANLWAASESGLVHAPLSTMYDHPILQPETTQVFLAVDDCNKGLARATVRVANLGNGRATFAIPNMTTAVVPQVSSGLAPSTITFTMEPGRAGVVRQPGTNLYTGATLGGGAPINIALSSLDAINLPNTIRVYMNFRQSDQRGIIYPVPTAVNNNEGLQDLVLDDYRGRIYISNSGFNRIEVFDTLRQKFLDPIEVGQRPRALALTPDGGTLYVANQGGESIHVVDMEFNRVIDQIEFPPIPRSGILNAVTPQAMAFGLSGLQFVMSNGTFWRVIGKSATPRQASSVTPATIPTPVAMAATPGAEYIVTLANNGNAYLYDALSDTYTTTRLLYNQAPQGYYAPLASGPAGSFFLAGGMILSPSLSVVGGSERAGVTTVNPPTQPGQPPTQTIVSAGQRNVASVWPVTENTFARLTMPVRQNQNTTTRDDPRPTIETVDIRTGGLSVAAIAPENPLNTVFGAARIAVPPRQLVVDSRGTAYALTVSGLSVVPLSSGAAARRPLITGGSRGIVNSNDGTPNYRPGSFITVNGISLASPATAESIPLPTVLGGSCVVFNEVALPLLQSSDGQISAQIPDNVRPGLNVVQVRSLATASSSDPIVVSVQR